MFSVNVGTVVLVDHTSRFQTVLKCSVSISGQLCWWTIHPGSRQCWNVQCQFSGESCWWTIHPASKQRSEGEKVRVGDDLILVSVSSERYLVCIQSYSCLFISFNDSSVKLQLLSWVNRERLLYVFFLNDNIVWTSHASPPYEHCTVQCWAPDKV